MDSDDVIKRGGRGRGRSRGRGSRGGRGRGRGRGKKIPTRVVSSEDEISQDQDDIIDDIQSGSVQQTNSTSILQSSNVQATDPLQLNDEDCINNKENENIDSGNNIKESNVILPIQPQTIDMEADISQLEAPTFTTITRRGPPEPMLRLKWDHKVSLIGEKVLNPMIHCCDQCDKPILVYGRMIPCKHVFCLKCAQAEPVKICPRCKDKVLRVEQSGLGTVFMCIHGGSRYGNTGCRRTYLSQRDLQAHINHRHVTQAPAPANDNSAIKSAALMDTKNIQSRKLSESSNSGVPTSTSRIQQQSPQQMQQPRSCQTSSMPSNASVQHQILSSISSRNINNPNQTVSGISINNQIQDAQQALDKVTIQQQSVTIPPPTMLNQLVHHGPPPAPHTSAEAMAAYYNSTSLQSYVNAATGTYSAPQVQPIITQNYSTVPSITPQQNAAALMTMQMQGGPPPPPQNIPPGAFYSFGQHFGHQMPPPPQHYSFDPTINQQQQWSQQQYYR